LYKSFDLLDINMQEGVPNHDEPADMEEQVKFSGEQPALNHVAPIIVENAVGVTGRTGASIDTEFKHRNHCR